MRDLSEYSPDVTIYNAKQDELPDILALLDGCELPREGLAAQLPTLEEQYADYQSKVPKWLIFARRQTHG